MTHPDHDSPGNAGAQGGGWGRRLGAAGLLLAAPVLVAVVTVLLHDRLPDPMPTHWNVHGEVNGTMTLAANLALALGISAVAALAGIGVLIWGWRNRGVAVTAVLLGWVAWLLAVIQVGSELIARDANRAADVTMSVWQVLLFVAISLIPAVLLYLTLPAQSPPAAAQDLPRIALEPGERVVWIGRCRSRLVATVAGVLLLVAVVAVWLQLVVALVCGAVAIVLIGAHAITVRIDRRGVRVGWGPLGWPHHRYPLEQISSAEAAEIEPMSWGGWGYRLSGRGIGIVIRRGEGLVLHRDGKLDVAITVDDADQAAALVNALVSAP